MRFNGWLREESVRRGTIGDGEGCAQFTERGTVGESV